MTAAFSNGRRGLLSLIACMVGALIGFQSLNAHNLNQRTNYLVFDDVTLDMIKARAKAGQQLLRAGDTVGLVLKATPDVGTPTGAGGVFHVLCALLIRVLQIDLCHWIWKHPPHQHRRHGEGRSLR